jgi:hypothetical protein
MREHFLWDGNSVLIAIVVKVEANETFLQRPSVGAAKADEP